MDSRTPLSQTALAAARSLVAQLEAGRLAGELAAEGVDALLIKGPATEAWLYDEGEVRTVGDIDVVVAPHEYRRAEAVLGHAGFVSNYDGAAPADSEVHADTWVSGSQRFPVDLHRRLWGFAASPAEVWEVLWASREPMRFSVGGTAQVPAAAVRALLLALHAAHHRGAAKPVEDLRRAVARVPGEVWLEARDVAVALGASGGLAEGLRLCAEALALRERLGLPADGAFRHGTPPAHWDGPPTSLAFARLAAMSGTRERAVFLRREMFPSAAFMRHRSVTGDLARRGTIGLCLSYPLRWARLAVYAKAGFRFARRQRDERV